ncbi:DUF4962 domain-containing protein [Niallia taxi]|uniref:DUF4962 domain-containing protein n=1 Tax=Niallia taxi TaxID=2499688 RepID=UPI0032B87D4D
MKGGLSINRASLRKAKRKKLLLLFLVIIILLSIIYTTNKLFINENIDTNQSSKDIVKLLKRNNPNQSHPRLLVSSEEFKKIKDQIKTDPNLKTWYERLESETDTMLNAPTVTYNKSDGVRLLPVSRMVLDRVLSLSLMYQLTGDEKYSKRAWEEMSIVADDYYFPDWNPKHFLDTAEMTTALAIGFDWLYETLDSNQKSILKNAIIKKGLYPAQKVYNNTADSNEITTFWKETTDNWNTVSNAGIALGALAIADESSDTETLAGDILYRSIKSIKNSLQSFAPDGGTSEGPSYWSYSTLYMSYFLSSLDTSLGTDFGLSSLKGISETGYFPIYLDGPKGIFNIGDGSSSSITSTPQMFWLANKFNNPIFSNYGLTKGYNVMNIVWYRSNSTAKSAATNISLDKSFLDPNTGLATFRSSWEDNGIFAALHAGNNQSNHGDLDIGTFVLDALGERWAEEVGSDSYSLDGYFDRGNNRWNYYRKRAEGQNTIVINPSQEPDQNIDAKALITDFNSAPNQGYAVIDMTRAYKDALIAKRGIALTHNRQLVLLQDELQLKTSSEIYWFMHTKAGIEFTDNRKTAILSISGKKMYAHILSPSQAYFANLEASPLKNSPNPEIQTKNNEIRKLSIHLKNVKETNISVIFTSNKNLISSSSSPLPLSSWKQEKVLLPR